VIFGTWYSYDEAGDPTWYLFVGALTDADSVTADVYGYSGPPLSDEAWDHTLLEENVVGSMMIDFIDEDTADLSITVNGISGQYPLVRIGSD
jgi:hypothetical protein